MPQSRLQQSTSSSTSTATTETTTAANTVDNSLLNDVLSGRAMVNGRAEDWFARGIDLQKGMKGDVIRELQTLVNTSADGDFGPMTHRAVCRWQKSAGFAESGVVDSKQWEALQANRKTFRKPQGEAAFADMWAAHPHNYLDDASQNTASGDLNVELGFKEDTFENTCAVRMSTMLNRMGGEYAITPEKALAAGLGEMRSGGLYLPRAKDPKTESTKDRLIVSAREMMAYLEHNMGAPDVAFPEEGRNLYRDDATNAVSDVKAACSGRKGFICFDKLRLKDRDGSWSGYNGSGHVDIFDNHTLSDGDFYPAQRVLIWYVT